MITCGEGKNFIGNKYIHATNFYILIVVGLLFRFDQFFGYVAFSFTGRLRNISALTKIFHNIIIVYRIIDYWQKRTQCNGKNDEYGNEKPQPFLFLATNILLKIFLAGIYDENHRYFPENPLNIAGNFPEHPKTCCTLATNFREPPKTCYNLAGDFRVEEKMYGTYFKFWMKPNYLADYKNLKSSYETIMMKAIDISGKPATLCRKLSGIPENVLQPAGSFPEHQKTYCTLSTNFLEYQKTRRTLA
ncbi:MAG: hypothetical protein ACOVRK_07425 [Chryseobacterium taeanense]